MSKWRWQDYVSVLVGAWTALSPWALGLIDSHPTASLITAGVGVAVALLAAFDLDLLSAVDEWLLVALGAWLVVSPWVLGFAELRGPAASTTLAGVAVVALTLWEIGSRAGWRNWRGHAHG